MANEKFGDFDPVAAAEAMFDSQDDLNVGEMDEDERTYREAVAQRETVVIEALAKRGIQLGPLGEFGLAGSITNADISLEEARSKWDEIAARQIAGEIRLDDE